MTTTMTTNMTTNMSMSMSTGTSTNASTNGHKPELLSSGVPGFDDVLRGGLASRRIYLLTGAPGSGKTTFAMQFLLEGARRGEKCLYVTLSESEDELRSVAASHGWDLSGILIRDLSIIEDQLADELENSLFNPADVELRETTKPILDEISRERPQRVVFDSLSELRMLAGSVHRFRRRVLALKQHLAACGSTSFLVDDGAGDPDDHRNLASLVHGVIEVEQRAQPYGKERRQVRVVKLRGQAVVGGHHDFEISHGGARVFPRRLAPERSSPVSADNVTSSGDPGLDKLFGGGVQRGTSTLVVGPAGSGKSTITSLFAHAAASRGERVALFTFEETRTVFETRCRGLGIPFDDHFAAGRAQLTQIDPAELAPQQFVHLVRTAVEKDGARVVVIDSLNGFMNAMPEERFLSLHLHELLVYVSHLGASTFMVMTQHGLVGSTMAAPVDVSYVADNAVVLRFFEAQGQVRKALSVIKRRAGPHESTIRELRTAPGRIEIGDPLDAFHGILTGMPIYSGANKNLLGEHDETRR